MFITRECDYAIRIIRAVSDGKLHNIHSICEAEHLPSPMAYKLARLLEKTGYLKSVRGPKGGYTLNVDPHNLTLYDICFAVDKELFVTKCIAPDYSCSRNSNDLPCKVHREFHRIQNIMIRELKAKSLYEILNSNP